MKNQSTKIQKNLNRFSFKCLQALYTLVISMFFMPLSGRAQCDSTFHSNSTLAEKIYLQTDGKVYTTGNTVWFKCIITNAFNHKPLQLSGVLYVELISSDERIRDKKIIKIRKGIGEGFFDLDEKLPEGVYQIRAYTQWNKNFGDSFIFKEYITVFTPKNNDIKPISNVTVVKKQGNEYRLLASVDPQTIDSLHKNKLKIYITVDDKKDSLLLSRGDDKKYRMDYPIASNQRLATIQLQTANRKKYTKTILINEEIPDLQFFPESGLLVHGLQNRIGVKALDASGKGITVQGEIIDQHESVIQTFKTNQLGMGSFVINRADSSKTYFARVASPSDKTIINVYPLPRVTAVGNVLSVNRQNGELLVTVNSNYLKNDSIILRVSHRGVDKQFIKAGLTDGVYKKSISAERLPEGIIAFTLFDRQMHPVAERLCFNERPESRMKITLSTDKERYAKREQTKLDIKATNANGDPLNASLSVLTINNDQMGKLQTTRQNILSYFLLDSELKGEIENPGFYFGSDSCRLSHLDALMLTQGWRKYLYSEPLDKLPFKPEPALSVSGKVVSAFSRNWKKKAELSMIAFGKEKSFYKQSTDSLGRFNFILNDHYGKDLDVVIQTASKKTGENANYRILPDIIESPMIDFNQKNTVVKSDSIVQMLVKKSMARKKNDDLYSFKDNSIKLKEVTVKGVQMTKSRKFVWEEYGEPNTTIEGKEIQSKEAKWSFGLYSVLKFNYSDVLRVEKNPGGWLTAWIDGPDITFVVIDGIPVCIEDYYFIQSIPPSEVRSIEIIKYATNAFSLCCKVFGKPDPCLGIKTCGVIAIYTYSNNGLFGVMEPVGISKRTIPVFSAPREFYAPKYENTTPNDWRLQDLRALIHWAPTLKTDSIGTARTSFYNADTAGKMKVVVEAISDKGEIGYQELEYIVKGK